MLEQVFDPSIVNDLCEWCRERKTKNCAPEISGRVVQRKQNQELCTRNKRYSGVENSKVEFVHQEERVLWCRDFKSEICAPEARGKVV